MRVKVFRAGDPGAERECAVTCLIGYFLAECDSTASGALTLLSAVSLADVALYEAKRGGRNVAMRFGTQGMRRTRQ